jgi:hypothetical protein
MNIYQKYSNNNVIPELLFPCTLIRVQNISVVGVATVGVLFPSVKNAPPGYDYIFFFITIFILLLSGAALFLKCRKNELHTISIFFYK